MDPQGHEQLLQIIYQDLEIEPASKRVGERPRFPDGVHLFQHDLAPLIRKKGKELLRALVVDLKPQDLGVKGQTGSKISDTQLRNETIKLHRYAPPASGGHSLQGVYRTGALQAARNIDGLCSCVEDRNQTATWPASPKVSMSPYLPVLANLWVKRHSHLRQSRCWRWVEWFPPVSVLLHGTTFTP